MQKDFMEIKDLYRKKEEYIDKDVKVAGWIRTSRLSKNFGFIELNDGSFFKNMQIIVDEKLEKIVEKIEMKNTSNRAMFSSDTEEKILSQIRKG